MVSQVGACFLHDACPVLQIKGSLLTWLQRDCTIEQQALPPFLRNKLTQAIVGVVKAEYPAVWPNFFRSAQQQNGTLWSHSSRLQ